MDTRIESEIAGLRTQIEQAKFSILQYLVGVATGSGALLVRIHLKLKEFKLISQLAYMRMMVSFILAQSFSADVSRGDQFAVTGVTEGTRDSGMHVFPFPYCLNLASSTSSIISPSFRSFSPHMSSHHRFKPSSSSGRLSIGILRSDLRRMN